MSSADQWRWTDDDGVQRLLNGDELRAAIRDGRLKPTTLVWRRGMKSWKPAGELSELTIEDPPTADTVTQENPTARRIKPGVRRPPTPSIPAPGLSPLAPGGVQPSNMVNIAALRAQQGGSPKRPRTMMGVGDGRAKPPDANPVSIPAAPRMPSLGYRGGDKDAAEAVVGGAKPDGGWKDGAARRDDDEETVTRVRTEEEAATLTEQKQPPKAKPRAKRSVPPPRKRSVPPPRKGGTKRPMPGRSRRTIGGQPKTLVSGDEPNKQKSQIPEPVASNAVLSEAFPSKVGRSAPGDPAPAVDRSHTLASPGERKRMRTAPGGTSSPFKPSPSLEPDATLDASTKPDGRPPAEKIDMPTAPMPAVRPAGRSRPDPEFASEPWELKPKPPASAPPEPIPPTEDLDVPVARAAQPTPAPPPPQRNIPTVVPPKPSFPALDARMIGGMAGGGLVIILLAFFVGRWTAPAQTGIAAAARARSGYMTVPLFARSRTTKAVKLRPCLMMRAPSRFAAAASHRIPVEMLPTPAGRLAVGYALSKQQARGMLVDPLSGSSEELFSPDEIEEEISRVVPMRSGEELRFEPTLFEQEDVRNSMYVATEPAYVLGFDSKSVVRQPAPGGEKTELWALEPPGQYADALSAKVLGEQGTVVTYRYDGKIHFAHIDKSGAVKSPAVNVEGSGGKVGKPNIGSNGVDVSVVFADKPQEGTAPIEIRWARAPIGEPVKDATPLELPSGGPGGDAIAPAIAGLSGGRWLLMWTEGKPGLRVLRAQTYDRKYRPIGEALRVSPATGSFGQGTVGVVGESAIVVFFLATSRTYQIWGTVLQCH